MTVVVKPPLGGLVGWVLSFRSEAHQLVETILADDRCASFATSFLAFLSHPRKPVTTMQNSTYSRQNGHETR